VAPVKARDRVERRLARLLAGLSPAAQIRLSGRPQVELDGQRLEPEAQLLLSLREKLGQPVWDETLSVERGRELTREDAALGAGPRSYPVGAVRELEVAGVPARHYAPDEAGARAPLLVYYHGGGLVAGDLDTHDFPCRVLCRHAGAHVLSIGYRLAPEHRFPAWVEDALAAYDWARANAAALGADPRRVAVGGDSAGGTLATVVAQERRGERAPALQLLIYPSVDISRLRGSHTLFASGFYLTAELIVWYLGHFLPAGEDPLDPRRSPLLAPQLGGLAPAIVVTSGFDPLRDEGEEYARRLEQAGTPVLARRFSGLFHGFINSGGVSPACLAALVEVAGMTRATLSRR